MLTYIINTDAKKPASTIVKDGFLWRLCYMNDSDKGFYVRTNKKIKERK